MSAVATVRRASENSSSSRSSAKQHGGVETTQVQHYSVPGTGIQGQVTTTHYQGPTTVTESHYQGPTTVTESHYQGPTTVTESHTTTQYGSGAQLAGGQVTSYTPYTTGSTSQYSTGGLQSGTLSQYAQGQASGQYVQGQASGQYVQGQSSVTTQYGQPSAGSYTVSGGVQTSGAISQYGQSSTTHHIQGEQYVTGGHTTTHHIQGEQYLTGATRVVTGEERVVGFNSRVDESRTSVISERIVEHQIKVPKRIVREEVIEKVIIVPETVTREELIEDLQIVRETIIEVAKPIIQEKIVEVPEYHYVDKIVEYTEKIVQEKIREVPRIEYQERIHEVPKYITQEKIVEVPEIEYREIAIEKIVEVPEIREQFVIKEVAIPTYVDKPVAEYVNREVPTDVDRNIPIPVEAITTFEYRLPQFRPRVNKIQYPVYMPRFIEVPVAQELFEAGLLGEIELQASRLGMLASQQAVSLCEVENLATDIRRHDISAIVAGSNFSEALTRAWKSGRLGMSSFQQTTHTSYVTSGNMVTGGSHMISTGPVITTTTGPMITSSTGPIITHSGITNSGGMLTQGTYSASHTTARGKSSRKHKSPSKSSRSGRHSRR